MVSNGAKNCPACLAENSINLGIKNSYSIDQCRVCQTIFAKIFSEDDKTVNEIEELYDHYYDTETFDLNEVTEHSLQKVVNTFENFRQTGKILDIGFGQGAMLNVAAKNNWECYGTEVSPQALQYGESQGWKVSTDVFSDNRFPENGFDVVTMIEVIEHVPNPDFFFQTVFSMLRPNGLFYMTTPNIQSINWRRLGIEWSVVCPPEHIILWSPSGMRKALQRNNFTLKKICTEGFNPVEILNKFKSKKKDEVMQHRNEAAFALNAAFSSSSWRRAVKTSINWGLTKFQIGDGIKIWAVKMIKRS